ncbi:MAG TPA: LacI family transcriptional regulator, partial [Roseibacterium sp.]|nr:LacI family transcriptional regulator [Roseibacterium sp.]
LMAACTSQDEAEIANGLIILNALEDEEAAFEMRVGKVRTMVLDEDFEMRTPVNPNANKRRVAYIEAMETRGLEPRVVAIDGDGWEFEEIGRQGAHDVLSRGELSCDTVLCSNDRLAIGFLAACYERGLRVGNGPGCALRVASHDDHPFSRFTCPALTTAAHDYDAVSKTGVETLFQLIENGGRFDKRRETLFPAHLIIRASA